MKKGRILRDMRAGRIHDVFQEKVAVLKKLIVERPLLRDEDYIGGLISSLQAFLQALRFAYFFVVPDYDDLARIFKLIDRFSMPDGIKDLAELKKFERQVGHLLEVHLVDNLKKRLRNFSQTEIFRLDEALITLKEEAYLSSIVMSVSAAEGRLHLMVQHELPGQYKKDKLAKAPLGTLLNQISSNKKYKKIKERLSEKFPSLLTMCNHYRIFSAHPKQEVMNYQDALAIFGLVMSFLLASDSK